MSVSSPFLPLIATEVRWRTLPSGTTRKLTSWLRFSMSLFGPVPGLSIFSFTVLAAASKLIQRASVCVVFSGPAARAACDAPTRARANVPARPALARRANAVLRNMRGALLFNRGPSKVSGPKLQPTRKSTDGKPPKFERPRLGRAGQRRIDSAPRGARMAVSADAFRHVLGHWTSGVTIVTSAFGDRIHGMTVSAFSSVSLEPPLVLVCADKTSHTQHLIEESRVFAANILAQGQEAL